MPYLLALFCLLSASSVCATTWKVPDEVPTIAAGLDSAVAGDTVLVGPGTYAESHLTLRGPIVLKSAMGPSTTRIIPSRSSPSPGVPGIRAYGGEINGFWIEGFEPGIIWDGSALIHGSAVIRNNVLRGNYYGISFAGTSVIENNTIIGSEIAIHDFGSTPAPIGPTIRNNIIWAPSPGAEEWTGSFFPAVVTCNNFRRIQDVVENNIAADPQFCGAISEGEFFIGPESPCAPGNTPGCELIGALPVGCSTALKTASWTVIKLMYR